jgi:hypothetical protein
MRHTRQPRAGSTLPWRQESANPPESHEWNTIAHLNNYEGRPEARPFTREELQQFFDYADDQVERAVRAKPKGALAAYRDATIFKVIYGWGLFSGAQPCVAA